MLGKSPNAVFFRRLCVQEARKVGLLKRRVRTLLAEGWTKIGTPPAREAKNTAAPEHFWKTQLEKWHAACARSAFGSQKLQTHHVRNTFGRCNLKKWHAACARSTFGSQNRKNTLRSGHFWKSSFCSPVGEDVLPNC